MRPINPGATKSCRNHREIKQSLPQARPTIFPPGQTRHKKNEDYSQPIHGKEAQEPFLYKFNWCSIRGIKNDKATYQKEELHTQISILSNGSESGQRN